ncbi:MAG: hypothetical protein IH991_01645 [Planctomycetes bacterium]|nr:hypothetical protein [Planctomycetota bacterium]
MRKVEYDVQAKKWSKYESAANWPASRFGKSQTGDSAKVSQHHLQLRFRQMARWKVNTFGVGAIRVDVRPAVPIKRRPAPAPRKVEPKKPERK